MAQRYQREIEEILDKVNDGVPDGGKPRRSKRKSAQPQAPRRARSASGLSLSPSRLVMAGVVLLIVAFAFNATGLAYAGPLAWVGIGLFIAAYVMFFTRPRRIVERRWRGQSIEDAPEPNGLLRLWRWITRG